MKFHDADSFLAWRVLGLLRSAMVPSKHDAVCAAAAPQAFPAVAGKRKTY